MIMFTCIQWRFRVLQWDARSAFENLREFNLTPLVCIRGWTNKKKCINPHNFAWGDDTTPIHRPSSVSGII